MTLLAKMYASAPSRIVNVSSLAHNHATVTGIEFDKINQEGAQSSWNIIVFQNLPTCYW
ncbi:1726_t:CDS:2, partial [Funneliformis geosporum]